MNRLAGLRRLSGSAPVLVIVGVAFAGTAIWVRSIHTFSIMPDELGYVKQSLQIARTGLPVTPGDFYFNSWGQLLPLVSAPIFGSMGIVSAFYTAHTLYALLLASAAIPAYLLARELSLGTLGSVLVAALTVAVPWLALAGVVMTENVAYPVFVWTILAILRTVHRPSAGRDGVAIVALAVAFFARTQMFVLGPILIICVVLSDLGWSLARREDDGVRRALAEGLRRSLSLHRVLWLCSGLAAVALAALAASGSGASVFGQYVKPVHGNLLPPGTLGAGLEQLDAIALAVGVVPLILAAVWALTTLMRPHDPVRYAFAVVAVLTTAVFVVMLGSFQQRILDGDTTDRYLFYIVPLLATGSVAWVEDRRGTWAALLATFAAVAWLVGADTLHVYSGFTITNPSFNFHRVLNGLGARVGSLGLGHVDSKVVIVAAVGLFLLLADQARRRLPTAAALLVTLVPLLGYGATSTGYAMTKLAAEYASIPASHPRQLNWIDRAVPSGARVGLLLAPVGTVENTLYTWWQPNFWNRTVVHDFVLPGGQTFSQGFVSTLEPDLATGRLRALDGVNYLAKLTGDARLGFRGAVVASSGGISLYRLPAAGAVLSYATTGLNEAGAVMAEARPALWLYGSRSRSGRRVRVELDLQAIVPERGCPCSVRLGIGGHARPVPVATATSSPAFRLTQVVPAPPAGGRLALPLLISGARGAPAFAELVLTRVRTGPA